MDAELDILSEESVSVDVTPLVNVALVLVLIFLVTSPFLMKQLMGVKLPEAVTTKTESQENITISISPDEGYAINEIPISKDALAVELSRQIKKSGISYVLIRADERVPHGEVEDLMKLSKQLRIRRIAFATIPKIR
jgi:biopolymer transport protein ExbD